MKRGVKQKYCEYFVLLNFICGCVFYAIYNTGASGSVGFGVGNSGGVGSGGGGGNGAKGSEDYYILSKRKDSNWTRILFWTTYFGEYDFGALRIDHETFRNCPVKCQLTFDKRLFGLSDGVVFHARDITRVGMPLYHPQNQLWIFLLQESPEYTFLDLKQYSNVFNWTMTYRKDSDIYHPYGQIVPIDNFRKRYKYMSPNNYYVKAAQAGFGDSQYLPIQPFSALKKPDSRNSDNQNEIHGNLHNHNQGQSLHLNNNNNNNNPSHGHNPATRWSKKTQRLLDKPKLVAWVVSNCHTYSNREGFVHELENYIPIDIYGQCGDYECDGETSQECYPLIAKTYKFYLAFENSLCTDYVTEKFFDALLHDIVPVVYGGANYSAVAPPGSFINARDFSTALSLAEHLIHLHTHPEEYLKFFVWKEFYRVVPSDGWCSLCLKLKNLPSNKNKRYNDIWHWWHHNPTSSQMNPTSYLSTSQSSNLRQNQSTSTISTTDAVSGSSHAFSTSTCLIAPSFPSETWFSKVVRYLILKPREK